MTEQDRTTVWRMITHHKDTKYALQWTKRTGRIAIGWGLIGDIKAHEYNSADNISVAIKERYPERGDAGKDGGYSLRDFCYHVRIGDLVILNAEHKHALVVDVVGDYEFKPTPEELPLGDYQHQRRIKKLEINPDDLWRSAGSDSILGRNKRGTLIECRKPIDVTTRITLDESYNPAISTAQVHISADEVDTNAVYQEGAVRQTVVNAYERNSQARRHCIAHYGTRCDVCELDFGERYGDIGTGFIHVHHLRPLSEIGTQYEVDPVTDLRPVCPNCHAIIHRRNPPYSIEEVKAMLR